MGEFHYHLRQAFVCLAAGAVFSAVAVSGAEKPVAANDTLLELLQKKGVLTASEAQSLRQEAAGVTTAKTERVAGLPSWVTNLKFGGDFRGRYEGHYTENAAQVQRDRLRMRVRLGAVMSMTDDFELGLRLSTSDPVSGFANDAGNPVSGNSTFQDNGARKFMYLDVAYARWNGLKLGDVTGSVTFGKMEYPFAFSHNVFDPDYNPEGMAGQLSYALNDRHTLKAVAGGFVLDELAGSSRDPYLLGVQLVHDAKWTKQFSTSLALGFLNITSVENLGNANVPNVNRGNTRNAATAPAAHFNPIVADAAATYIFPRFPGYGTFFPVKLSGEFLHNPAVATKNESFMAGVTFGKAGKKGLWELSYQYRYIGADSWYEETVADDFVGFYQVQQPNAGFAGTGAGIGGGTNLRGHVLQATYGVTDSLSLMLSYYRASLISPVVGGSRAGVDHLLVDFIWKF